MVIRQEEGGVRMDPKEEKGWGSDFNTWRWKQCGGCCGRKYAPGKKDKEHCRLVELKDEQTGKWVSFPATFPPQAL